MSKNNNLALVCCNNGLGHVRRMFALAIEMVDRNLDVSIYCDPKKFSHLCMIYSIFPKVNVIPFAPKSDTPENIEDASLVDLRLLVGLESFDTVISDNLLNVLTIRQDAWLSGSFLWPGYYERLNRITQAKADQIKLLSSDPFTSPYMKHLGQVHTVGLYPLFKPMNDCLRDSLLISVGTGGAVEIDFNSSKLHSLRNHFEKVYLEPKYFKEWMPSFIEPAKYTPEMYSRLSAAIVRPGVGTLTDLFVCGIKPILVYEETNVEMLHNSSILCSMGIAEAAIDFESAIKLVTSREVSDLRMKDDYDKISSVVRFDGAREVTSLILNDLRSRA